ncbi:uncharacterized protein AMSG_06645 [Thecamonas trahens ATCC 50062]|uniref:RING-type E3 ubiquitin transferase n=1 Tax=Thecamonas trahens ATCC 50062 TaxID=461836 RepID=A0A0L0DEV6_THETB|nr:hypothetical protein AMSG_06645 [Thecamonas trahens ATCC 50062]KNC50755.1 hypothetical protein AMSG_06645 [Thecamonas trahens ATCC 50062]|eukprot:XP_013756718.1 hypothetical protein AMSG_06645 [Thecamonas trahens ATCC 50062]
MSSMASRREQRRTHGLSPRSHRPSPAPAPTAHVAAAATSTGAALAPPSAADPMAAAAAAARRYESNMANLIAANQCLSPPAAPLTVPSVDQLPTSSVAHQVSSAADLSPLASTVADDEKPDDDDDDDSGSTCSICFEPWTNQGRHRVTATKCGHLFGRACIRKWLSSHSSCPTCKKRIRATDLRYLYVTNISVVDNAEKERALRLISKCRSENEKINRELGKVQLENRSLATKLEAAQREIVALKAMIAERRPGAHPLAAAAGTGGLARASTAGLLFEEVLSLPLSLAARVMDLSPAGDVLLVSSANARGAGKAHGFTRISLVNSRFQQYVGVHDKAVRDVGLSQHDHDLVLSVGFDARATLTSLSANSPVLSCVLDGGGWSAVWHPEQGQYFAVGTSCGTVALFDTRKTNAPTLHLALPSRQPVHSLAFSQVGDDLVLLAGTCSSGVSAIPLGATGFGTAVTITPPCITTAVAAGSGTSSVLLSYRASSSSGPLAAHHEVYGLEQATLAWQSQTTLPGPASARVMARPLLQ